MFSGEETQEYADEAANFGMYNASTVVHREPAIAGLLGSPYPIGFERDPESGEFVEVMAEVGS